ncbi:MAG: 3-phosphoshikimate 1-carboxyvinyltransferase [Patescibacteria group bacterium]
MNIIVKSTKHLTGTVVVPSSKSQSIRALLLASVAQGKSELTNILESDDTNTARTVLADLKNKSSIFTGDSGITTRFILPLLGLRFDTTDQVTLDCSQQMRVRPIDPLLQSLRELGMSITETPGTIYPLKISGRLVGGATNIDGTTSQYLSALLLALPLAQHDSIVTVNNLNERPYVKMTTRWLDELNIKYSWIQIDSKDIFKIIGRQTYQAFNKTIPGDFSSASYLIAAGVLCGDEVIVQGLDFSDMQGDKRLIEILQHMGADIIQKPTGQLVIHGGNKLTGQIIDCNDIPDLVPTLAVIATQAYGVTELINVPQARLKETDRLHSMFDGLTKLGAKVTELSDGLIIQESKLTGTSVPGYNDHRTVMALTIAGLVASGETTIATAESINKTCPPFIQLIKSLGAICNTSS